MAYEYMCLVLILFSNTVYYENRKMFRLEFEVLKRGKIPVLIHMAAQDALQLSAGNPVRLCIHCDKN
jgi:hypothetical protein